MTLFRAAACVVAAVALWAAGLLTVADARSWLRAVRSLTRSPASEDLT